MSTPPALDFALLFVADLDSALSYFTETLGFTRVPDQDTPIFRYLRGGEGGIDFALRQSAPDTPPPGAVQLYFRSPDLAALHSEWSGRGAQLGPVEQRPFGATFSIGGSDGLVLSAWSPRD
jgi:catechol 2,3-dioxygenase-like lactoylglutathione lyase family enzyme